MATSTFSSPIVTIFFRVVGVVLMMNRVLYTMATYNGKKIEREEDLYLKELFCNKVDHSQIGRHTSLCLEAGKLDGTLM